MATQYFFAHGDAQHGPYSASQLLELANAGKIQPTDAVWRAGVGRPIPAWRVKNLFPGLPAPPEPGVAENDASSAETVPAEHEADAEDDAAFTPSDEKPITKPQEKERPRRVLTIRGGILVSQDGKYVSFRKKCPKCSHEEQGKHTTLIRPGSMKVPYFCRKCRKGRTVEMTAVFG
jgi:hypothetical protein